MRNKEDDAKEFLHYLTCPKEHVMPIGITKREWEVLHNHGYHYHGELVNGNRIEDIIYIIHNPSKLHDSGYPYIRVFGNVGKMELVDMGWHDHILTEMPVNQDAFGKNIIHMMPWGREKGWTVRGNTLASSLSLHSNGEWW